MPATLLWYDLETFGTNSKWDRIGQFAAIRTNGAFEQIGDPIEGFCRVTPDYVPEPDACILTRLTPTIVAGRGSTEAEFAALVHGAMIEPNTCVVGYNNLRFDDEFIRNLFYRNFYDPYEREYASGNSRWDIIDLLRMTHDLRPDGIAWIEDSDGKPVFRLEELTVANGIPHRNAHDAVADVRATIDLAKTVHDAQPKLFRYYYSLRKKDEVRRLLNLQHPRPLVHTSGMFTRPGGCTSIVYPVSVHPDQSNSVICYDLRFDPSPWIDLPAEEIRRRVFTAAAELDEVERVHLKAIHINRSPAIAPLSTLNDERAKALCLDTRLCERHAAVLADYPEIIQKVRQVYEAPGFVPYRDPELQLYSGGFFGDEDRAAFETIRGASPERLVSNPPELYDPRGPELLRRYIARNYYDYLPQPEKERWRSFCASRLLAPEIDDALDYGRFRTKVENRLARGDTPAAHKPILRDLLKYAEWLEDHILK